MPNEYTKALFHSEWDFQNEQDDYLAHYGILGMHWGIRRFQPYGQGYDAEHEGREVGLAARMAGGGSSYSSLYGRNRSTADKVKSAAKAFGKRAGSAANEAVERFNYASERTAQGLLNAGKKAKSGLAKYAAGKYDSEGARIYENAGASALAKGVFSRFSSDAKTKVSDLRRTSFDDVKGALGSGASRFQEAMSKTAVKSKEFGRNAAMTAALLGGALDPKSNASQTIQSRFDSSFGSRSVGGHRTDYGDTAPGGKLFSALYGTTGTSTSKLGRSNASMIRSAGRSLTPDSSTMSFAKRAQMSGNSLAKLSDINQRSTAPRWKGNDPTSPEARKAYAEGALADLNSRSGYRPGGSTRTSYSLKPYKDYDKVSPAAWKERQEEHMDYRDRVNPDRFTRSIRTSKTGNMTNEEFLKRLRSTGNKIAPINQVAERRKTRPLDYRRSGIADRGTNSGVPREDVNLENVVDFRNHKMPQLVQTQSQLSRELKKRGVSFAMINNTPVPMIPKDQNKESVDALIKRLGIGTI